MADKAKDGWLDVGGEEGGSGDSVGEGEETAEW